MQGKGQEIVGKVEEGLGKLTGNEKLQGRGQIDQDAGQAKQEVVKEKRAKIQEINQATREAKSNL